jgi:elongation factor P
MRASLFSLALLAASASAFAPVVAPRRTNSALNVAIDTSDIKNGMTIELEDGEPYKILNFSIMKQARGAAKTTIKFKNLMRGNTVENTYISGKKLETAQIDRKDNVFSYADEVSKGC